MERGVSFIGGRGRVLSFSGQGGQGRKLDGIHVETHVSKDGGSSGNAVEVSEFGILDDFGFADNHPQLRSFEGRGSFGRAILEPNSEFEQEVWEPDIKYNA
jgi:hypothetical protein